MEFLRDPEDFTYHFFDEDVPMAKLVKLCRDEEVPIREVFVSDIVEKYIAYVHELEEKSYENIGDFLELASTLLEIKSKMLLPKPEPLDDMLPTDEETVGDDVLFARRLELYKKLMELSEQMGEMEQLNRFYRDPYFDEKDYNVVIKNFDLDKLIGAFKQILERIEYTQDSAEPKTIVKERFTVAERLVGMIDEIRSYKKVLFFSLFLPDYTKLEVINTFLALLEILKKGIATAEQETVFGDITICWSPQTDDELNKAQEGLLTDVEEYH